MTSRLTAAVCLLVASPIVGCSNAESPASNGGGGAGGGANPGVGAGGPEPTGGSTGAAGGDAGGGGGANAGYQPTYPRLGSYAIGNPHDYDDEAFRADAAKRHLVIVSQWPGWQNGKKLTMAAVMADIKQRSKIGTKLFVYVNQNERLDDGSDETDDPVWLKLNAEKWWLYAKNTSGKAVRSVYGAGYAEINATEFSTKDADGKSWIAWKDEYDFGFIVTGDARDEANPSVDGFFLDNVFVSPRVAGDWNLDGTTESTDDPMAAAWTRAGEKLHYDHLRSLWPGSIQLGNVGDFGVADNDAGVLDQVIDGGVLEGYIGASWSLETWGGFEMMMGNYTKTMKALRGDKLGIFGHENWKDGDWQTMRYGLGACLLGDAYYYLSGDAYDPSQMLWFDEFDLDLGAAVDAAQTASWKDGVWRRDFEKGSVLVNPKGNGAKTVDLGGTFKHFAGTQDPKVNDGSTVTKVTLADRDGLVLLR